MAQKTGALIFDETADRYDIRFDIADYYGGLHCGECIVIGVINVTWMISRDVFRDKPRAKHYSKK